MAQALWLLGVRPVRDALNRATEIEVIPLDELKRPRMDVVMTVSGIFRDLFAPTMALLDKAVRRVAALDEPLNMNYVRRNVSERIDAGGAEFDDAVTRVFSNAPGNYGTNVNFMVMDSQWETADTLGDLFVTRKCFAYTRDSKGRTIEGREAPHLMDDALSRVEATYQNIDSFEVGITDVDHYFEYLGGISRAVEKRAQSRPAIYLSDSLSPQTKIRSLEETIRLETRAKTLNPKWYEGMLKHGFRGVAEIENHVLNTFGWSATADAVDPWIYTDIAKTFLLDSEMFNRLLELNPHSVRSLMKRLLEAHDRGYWNPDEEILEKLRDLMENFKRNVTNRRLMHGMTPPQNPIKGQACEQNCWVSLVLFRDISVVSGSFVIGGRRLHAELILKVLMAPWCTTNGLDFWPVYRKLEGNWRGKQPFEPQSVTIIQARPKTNVADLICFNQIIAELRFAATTGRRRRSFNYRGTRRASDYVQLW